MDRLSGFVSLHPYFKVPPDKLAVLKGILPEFVAKTRHETWNYFYEFTVNDDIVFCREGYVNAEALLDGYQVAVIIAEQRAEQVGLVELQLEPGTALFIGGDGGEVAAGHQAATCCHSAPVMLLGPAATRVTPMMSPARASVSTCTD